MHPLVGRRPIVLASLSYVRDQMNACPPHAREAVGLALNTTDASKIEAKCAAVAGLLNDAKEAMNQEQDDQSAHYVSRIDFVGIFQSILAKVFYMAPDLQGYGDGNPDWVTTLVEEVTFSCLRFFNRVCYDVHGKKHSLLDSIITELAHFRNDKFDYPSATPTRADLPENVAISLLGDWGGDNDAAKKVAEWVKRNKSAMGIHLGDIYYGGAKEECESFVRRWPFHTDPDDPSSSILRGSSFALNGNHEMYCGGEYYFTVVLPALGQAAPFFCLENQHWRVIGLDTAYNGGHLKPSGPTDPLIGQWNWLSNLLRDGEKRANILLTHHQPVSAHESEFRDSASLRNEMDELLSMEGIGRDAIFGWFFGHEHRCAVYRDAALPYNARLIGNGCIPHWVQHETEADPGCTPLDFVNRRETAPGSNTAVSSFANLYFVGEKVEISYLDEDGATWGTEIWNARDRLSPVVRFTVRDGTA